MGSSKEDDEKDAMHRESSDALVGECGLGPLRLPSRCRHIAVYVFVNSIAVFIHGVVFSYMAAILTTVQAAYGLTSTHTSTWFSLLEAGHISAVLFITYFLHAYHKPRILAVGLFISSVGCFCLCLPHFFIPVTDFNGNSGGQDNYSTSLSVCSAKAVNMTTGDSSTCEEGGPVAGEYADIVVAIFGISSFFMGVGFSSFNTLGFVYIDDNCAVKSQSTTYISVLFAMNVFGPVAGFLLGGVTVEWYYTLEETTLTPESPQWIGAWWVGFLLSSIINMTLVPFMFCFPKHLIPQREEDEISLDEKRGMPSIKKFFPTLWKFFKNPVFTLVAVNGLFALWVPGGYFSYAPKYMEVQFFTSVSSANIYTGIDGALAAAFASLLGGWLVSRYDLSIKQCSILLACTAAGCGMFHCLGFVFYCDTFPTQTNSNGDLSMPFNENCGCVPEDFHSVCVQGQTYYSACHAGCNETITLSVEQQVYTNCLGQPGLNATQGTCTDSDCVMTVPYILAISAASFTMFLGAMPGVKIIMSCAPDNLKSFSLGINSLLQSLLGWIPAPILYGSVVDSVCTLWSQSSCSETTGHCLEYNIPSLRNKLHGLNVGVQAVATLVGILLVLTSIWMEKRTKTWGSSIEMRRHENGEEPVIGASV